MKKIYTFDTTLRDGEQAAGVSLNPSEKLQIAKQLKKLNVDVIEVGFPVSNEEDYLAAELIAKEVKGPIICAFGRAMKEDINAAHNSIRFAKRKRLHLFLATSKLHLDKKLNMSEEKALEKIYDGVSYAKGLEAEVEFTPEDATRTEISYLYKTIETARMAGASIITIADTVGDSQPFKFYERVKGVYENFKGDIISGRFQLGVHCHNDKGQGVANSLMGILAGATQVHGTILGNGERTGNAALEQIIMNIHSDKEYFQAYTDIVTEEIYPTAQLVSQLMKLPIPINQPLVGKNAFSHESGIHQHGILNDPKTYEVFNPEEVGWKGDRFVEGKHSGRHIKEYLQRVKA